MLADLLAVGNTERYSVCFKAGLELRQRVDESAKHYRIVD